MSIRPFMSKLAEIDAMEYSDIISDIQTGKISLARQALRNYHKIGNIFQRIYYRIIINIILLTIRRDRRIFEDSYIHNPSDLTRSGIVRVLSRLGPAKCLGDIPKSSCQIYANNLTLAEQIRAFGITLWQVPDSRPIVIPVNIVTYEFLAKYTSLLEEAKIQLVPFLNHVGMFLFTQEEYEIVTKLSTMFSHECLSAITDCIRANGIVLCYDLERYTLDFDIRSLVQLKPLLETFAFMPKADIEAQKDDERRWCNLPSYNINYIAR